MKNIIKTRSCSQTKQSQSQPFPSEYDMVASFSSLLSLQKSKLLVSHEFNCGFGIADIVIYKKNDKEDAISLGKISPDWAFTLKSLPLKTSLSSEVVSELSGASLNATKKAIKEFILAGFCEKTGKNSFVKIKDPKLLCNSIIAVEAKLKDWRRALWQASRYKIFSSQSWVILDKHTARSAISNIKEFEKYNIGLATLATNGVYEEIFTPTPDIHKSELAFWKANSLLAKQILNSNSI